MLKADVIAHFGNGQKVAIALGLTKSAISQWKDLVPLDKALKLQAITGGVLSVDMAAYELPEISVRARSATRHVS